MKPVDRLTDDEFVHLVQRAVALPDAPPTLVQAAIDLWSMRSNTAAATDSSAASVGQAAWRLVKAVLSFDSWASPPLALGMRSSRSDTRHLLFSAMGRDIDLRISPADGHFALTGQILGPDESGLVELATQADDDLDSHGAQVVPLDALGEFRLDGVRGGTYVLTLRMGGDEIVLPSIVVGVRPA